LRRQPDNREQRQRQHQYQEHKETDQRVVGQQCPQAAGASSHREHCIRCDRMARSRLFGLPASELLVGPAGAAGA